MHQRAHFYWMPGGLKISAAPPPLAFARWVFCQDQDGRCQLFVCSQFAQLNNKLLSIMVKNMQKKTCIDLILFIINAADSLESFSHRTKALNKPSAPLKQHSQQLPDWPPSLKFQPMRAKRRSFRFSAEKLLFVASEQLGNLNQKLHKTSLSLFKLNQTGKNYDKVR